MILRRTLFSLALFAANALASNQVTTSTGVVEGAVVSNSSVRAFKGIPYAAAPVGPLRWKVPQPAPSWTGVRPAIAFGARCMQGNVFGDMVFRDRGPSEDCLYLNVWTPAESPTAKLPVMVWIYGGGFVAGAASEPRQDGSFLAKKGVVVVSMNYRLGVFGFFSHPDLTKESGHNASGNYGLLDQVAALQWVHDNVAAFGGDPSNVTIFGESAGSFSVSALMATPLAHDLITRAIGESGAFFSATLPAKPLADSERAGQEFAAGLHAPTLDALRAIPSAELLAAASKSGAFRFSPNVDGYFLPESVLEIYAGGEQDRVPLLAGWNADEGSYQAIFKKQPPTAANFTAIAQTMFKDHAAEFLKVYPASTDAEAKLSAGHLASDQFIGYSTWKWIEMQAATGKSPVYRYHFEQAPPAPAGGPPNGAYHSAEIEFVFEALASKPLPWRPEDWKVSDLMSSYWTNFAKTGNPNGPGLPNWPAYNAGADRMVMHLNAQAEAAPDQTLPEYQFLDSLASKK